jgi:hypothetical protein
MAPNSDTRENIITWFTNEFGFSHNAVIALHDVQALKDAQALSELVVGRLDIVPYIRTFVQYDSTFSASDQGQTLDV